MVTAEGEISIHILVLTCKGSEMVLQQRFSLPFLILSNLIVLADSCDRRCLANSIIAKKLISSPQSADSCSVTVKITSMQYETLSFDTKNMQMSSRVKVNMLWNDPGLAWNTTTSNATAIMLPVDKIWTPGLILDNAVDITVYPYKNDVMVLTNGTVDHAVILSLSVSCDINIFTYPFVFGDCPVAINGWSESSCGLVLSYPDNITMTGNSQSGEWLTENVKMKNDSKTGSRRYLSVTLSINPFSAMVTLILPSALIMLVDLVSFALPVQGGERNNLKVTLVLSFTMFLIILNDHLSTSTSCSPLLYYHFCFCLLCLVLSMVTSIVLTRLTSDDSIIPCKCSKSNQHGNMGRDKGAVVIATTKSTDLAPEVASIQKIAHFLENMEQKEQVANSKEAFVERLDKLCFHFFLLIDIIYIIIVAIVSRTDLCKPQKMIIFDKEDLPTNFNNISSDYYYY